MDEIKKQEILKKAQSWWLETIAKNHILNTEKLVNPREFNINPFSVVYLSNFLTGNSDPQSIAKALVYPRALGTSFTTIFGNGIQQFTSEVMSSFGSAVSGIDIEFIDQLDGRKKYCQLKSGPQTINKGDVKSIADEFTDIRRLSMTNNSGISTEDLIVGVVYGEESELSANYKNIRTQYFHPVYIGREFWHHLSGDENFYFDLVNSIGEVAIDADFKEELETVINKLAGTDAIKNISRKQ